MAATGKRAHPRSDPAEQEMREQEVLRANKELAAYFKGKRTEREARAALKIIKAFIRDRERLDAASRRPLPGAAGKGAVQSRPRKVAAPKKTRRRTAGRRAPEVVRPSDALHEAGDSHSAVTGDLARADDE